MLTSCGDGRAQPPSRAAIGILLALMVPSAMAAPRSSPGSSPVPAPPIVRRDMVPDVFYCNGFHKSYTCTNTLYLNKCRNSIKVVWNPLKFPGNSEWEKKHRNWCSITWDAQESIEERKYPPEKCERIMQIMAAALQGFPEVKWQDSPCTHLGTPDGVLYTSQTWESPKPLPFLHKTPLQKDLEPQAVRLEDVTACVLHNDTKRIVRCPVLPQREQSWLRKFLASVGVFLIIKNPVR